MLSYFFGFLCPFILYSSIETSQECEWHYHGCLKIVVCTNNDNIGINITVIFINHILYVKWFELCF